MMDIIYKGKKPELDLPYFGRQSRFFEFFEQCITPYLNKYGKYGETNSGSVSNAYRFAKLGYKTIINDAGEYSNTIAKAVLTTDKPKSTATLSPSWLNLYSNSYAKRAAVFAGVIDLYGYNASIPQELSLKLEKKINFYQKHLNKIKKQNVKGYKIYNDDLFNYLKKLQKDGEKLDVMFMDFAWPWRDGTKTEEYESSANTFSTVFGEKSLNVEIWDKNTVLPHVLQAVKLAKNISRYVFLSNQSSNFPTPEILEVFLLSHGIKYQERHTMLTNATNEDNLLKADFFREYLYIIKGDID